MKNMPREEIELIARNILNHGDIIAEHGTSIENAASIMATGFNYHRTSYEMYKGKNIESLCRYGWKENPPGDSTNVIIEIPKDFIKDLLFMDEEDYQNWIKNIISEDAQEDILNSFTSYETEPAKTIGNFSMPPTFKAKIPKEFVVGTFIWCNDKTYLRLKEDESALDNLSFISNDKFYSNLPTEEKQEFLEEIRKKIGLVQEEKKEVK